MNIISVQRECLATPERQATEGASRARAGRGAKLSGQRICAA